MSSIFANYNTIRDFSFNVDYDGLNIGSTPGLLCALYNGTTAAEALSDLRTSLNKFYKYPDSGFIDTPREAELLLLDIMLATSLDELFAGTIPTDPNDLTGYDNTACAVCSGPGDCPLAPGESVDIPSGGSYLVSGSQREFIIWPSSGSWASVPRSDGYYTVPGSMIETDCVAGWDLSFPFDDLSNDVFRIAYESDTNAFAQDISGGTTSFTLPAGTIKAMVYRTGSGGAPYDRSFTLRVTRPL
jgi:hypothetical protein